MSRAKGLSRSVAVWRQRLASILTTLPRVFRSSQSLRREAEQMRRDLEELERKGAKKRKPTAAERLELQRLRKRINRR